MAQAPADLHPSTRFVLATLLLHANAEGSADVTRQQVADFTALSMRSVDRALIDLRQRGMIGYPPHRRSSLRPILVDTIPTMDDARRLQMEEA